MNQPTGYPSPTNTLKRRGRQLLRHAITAAMAKAKLAILSKLIPLILITLVILSLLLFTVFIALTFVEVTDVSVDPSENVTWVATETGESLKYYKKYRKYGKQYKVPWQLLAAIHRVETNFGQNLKKSSAGALGHTQFMPCAWVGWEYYASLGYCAKNGDWAGPEIDFTDPENIHDGQAVDGNKDGKYDPWNVDDALAATAKRLAADKKSTGKGWFDQGGPVWKYNPLPEYVAKVEKYSNAYAKPVAKKVGGGTGQFTHPAPGTVMSSPYGPRKGELHTGQDFAGMIGTPIVAADSGTVVKVEHLTGSYGSYIEIDHGKDISTLYAHMWPHQVKVRQGQKVKKGQTIGEIGNNGRSTGPHLHFEVRVKGKPQDPRKYLK
ncbi:MAG: peptidoglycan DD-metalloendopeptidase family protein [Firmicutes bacterium]|nr:peptidoglycan DD-metalloendopeptidase family protein [Bacillota bacterium]